MKIQKRGRGRPVGPGKDDMPLLEAMADLMVARPGTRKTRALKLLVSNPDLALIRRIQIKWNQHSPDLLVAAQARREAAQQSDTAPRASRSAANHIAAVTAATRVVRDLYDSPVMRVMRELQDGPVARIVRELQNNPALRLAREMQNNPAVIAARAIHAGPALSAAREFHDSPAARMARDVLNTPAMRLVREQKVLKSPFTG